MGMESDAQIIRRKFKKVHYYLDYLVLMLNEKRGWWIFESHQYTIDEFRKLEYFDKVYAYTKKIGSDVECWFAANKLSEEGRNTYLEEREKINDRLHHLYLKVLARKSTSWERVKKVTRNIALFILDNLPTFKIIFPILESIENKLLPNESPIRLMRFIDSEEST